MRKINNNLPDGYIIRFALKSDIANIMKFIRDNWKEDHILATQKDFFVYEFGIHTREINFVLLLNPEKEIEGILGFIPYGEINRDIFTVMWKVLDNDKIMFGGVLLLQYLIENGKCRHIYSSGINEGTRNIYHYLGLQTDNLKHYYHLNKEMKQYVADIKTFESTTEFTNNDISMVIVDDIDAFRNRYQPSNNSRQTRKSAEYIIHRYFMHPIYKYYIFEILQDGISSNSFIVMRIQEHKNSKVLRIIDYLGDIQLLEQMGYSIDQLLDDLRCEYVDFYEYGIDESILKNAGFIINEIDSENIIPNYFSPFECKNINIGIVFEKDTSPILFKGDGDQDRPS